MKDAAQTQLFASSNEDVSEDSLSVEYVDDEDEVSVPLDYEITSYGADFDVEGLVRRLERGDIFIPSFQRAYVWDKRRASRFIESLLLGLPVPGIFLGLDKAEQYLVIDGQQRLKTLQYFYGGHFQDDKPFRLSHVQREFADKTYDDLDGRYRRKLDNALLHATIVRQNSPDDDDSSIYYVFERLNTGGKALQPQEIRASIYHGSLNELLGQLNQNESWRRVFGKPSNRMRDQELILRFFALFDGWQDFRKPMKDFLNRYMQRHRHLDRDAEIAYTRLFTTTIAVVADNITRPFRPIRNFNAAVYDAVMVGIAERLRKGEIADGTAVSVAYTTLLQQEGEFWQVSVQSSGDNADVRRRVELAIAAFTDIQ